MRPGGPEGVGGVAEGVVGVHHLDGAAVDDQVPHGSSAAGDDGVEIFGSDGGEVGDQRMFWLVAERLFEAPDEMFEDVS